MTLGPNGEHFPGDDAIVEDLDLVQPNWWNPNEMPSDTFESLKHGMKTKGWPKSEPLFVWATDETGKVRNIIVDGEHRWKAARALGWEQGPMVFARGMTEADAKKWTIALDQKRGRWNEDGLRALVREFSGEESKTLALDLGFSNDALAALIAKEPDSLPTKDDAKVESDDDVDEEFKELNEETVTTEHECPRCKFKF